MPNKRRFVLTDFTSPTETGRPRLCEAGRYYRRPEAIAHAAAKHDLVAKERPPCWTRPSLLTMLVALTMVDVAEAAAELQALESHAVEAVQPIS